jgi:cell division septum initiation protein DivIVA
MGPELLSGIQGLDQAARLRQDAGSDAERAVELHEHAEAITSWRDGCQSDKGDGSFTRYRSQDAGEPLSARQRQVPTQDLRRDAQQAWARFCACTKALPAVEAAPLWRLIAAEATIHIS